MSSGPKDYLASFMIPSLRRKGSADDTERRIAVMSASGQRMTQPFSSVEASFDPESKRHRGCLYRIWNWIQNFLNKRTSLVEVNKKVEVVCSQHRPRSLDELVKTTRFTKDELQTIYRGFKQVCPTGMVTESEFKDIYAEFFPYGDSNGYAHLLFRTLDTNGDGTITFEQFIESLSKLSRGTNEEKLLWCFELYDTNQDGLISRTDMLKTVTSIYELLGEEGKVAGSQTPADHVDFLFSKYDISGDGVITQEDFMRISLPDLNIGTSLAQFDTVI